VNAGLRTVTPPPSPEQPSSTPEENLHSTPAEEARQWPGSITVWLWRIRALLFVTLCATFGVLLIILPWTPKWTDNPLLLNHPELRTLVSSGFVRGLASGLGILDLWLGFWEAIHYHEMPKASV
jgi:hypothetical protein